VASAALCAVICICPGAALGQDAGAPAPAEVPTVEVDLGVELATKLVVDAGVGDMKGEGGRDRGGQGQARGKGDRPEWAPKLTATVKPVQVKLGDPITVEIKVRHSPDVSVNLPLKLDLGPFSELTRADATRQLGAEGEVPEVERTFTLKVAAYDLGNQTLPPVEVTALGPRGEMISLSTAAMQIDVRSVMANEPQPKLKELEPPVSVFQRTWWLIYLLIGLAAAGLVAVVTLLVARHLRERRRREAPQPPPVPPHITALKRLDALDVDRLIDEERYKELYLELSEIVRGYTGGRWGFDALEMTTSEIREALVAAGADDGLRMRLETFFNDCDLVKFARYTPEPDPAREAADEARGIVVDTQQQRAGEAEQGMEDGGEVRQTKNKEQITKNGGAPRPVVDGGGQAEAGDRAEPEANTDKQESDERGA